MALILIFAFLSVGGLVWAALSTMLERHWQVEGRLAAVRGLTASESQAVANPLAAPFEERILRPAIGAIVSTVRRLAPRSLAALTRKRLVLAGYTGPLTAEDFIGVQVASGLIFTAIGILLDNAMGGKALLFVLMLAAIGLYGPQFILSSRITRRKQQISDDLPDALDLMVVCVEAGLGFDAALDKVAEKTSGPLSDAFRRALHEITIGSPRYDALKGMADRVEVPDLTTFVASVVQADRLGVPIGNVLRLQADAMRELRKQRSEEKAMKAPVKMMFPMVFLILPVLLILIIGPAAISALKVFMQGGLP